MVSTRDRNRLLDKAYVRGTVIKSNLEFLHADLRDLEPELRDDVAAFSRRFDEYVHRLEAAADPAREPILAAR